MAQDDLILMVALLSGALLAASFLAWRGGDSRADVTLIGGIGIALGAVAGLLAVA